MLLCGALLAPLLFWPGRELITRGWFPGLAHFEFESYFHRALLLAALLLLAPLLRSLRVRTRTDLALEKNPLAGADLAAGFSIAAVPLLCGGLALIACEIYSLRHPFLWGKMPGVLAAALAVPILEELLFRGLILGVLLRNCSRWNAVLMVSALFSVIHFLKPPRLTTPNESVTWFSGFLSLGHSFWQFGDLPLVVASFFTLFVVGCILADARILTRSLWLSIGLHSGWIFADGLFSKIAHRETFALPWIGKDLLVGIVPLTIALASWALMRCWLNYAGARSQSVSRTR